MADSPRSLNKALSDQVLIKISMFIGKIVYFQLWILMKVKINAHSHYSQSFLKIYIYIIMYKNVDKNIYVYFCLYIYIYIHIHIYTLSEYVYTTLRNVILSFKTISTGAPEPISTELHHSSKKILFKFSLMGKAGPFSQFFINYYVKVRK